MLGLVVAVAAVVLFLPWVIGDDGDSEGGNLDAVAPVRYSAQLSSEATSGGAASVEVDPATGQVCYQVTGAVEAPFTVALVSEASTTVDLGTHRSGTLGCSVTDPALAARILASPESHLIQVRSATSGTVEGPLAYDPDGRGGIVAEAPGASAGDDPAPGAAEETRADKAGFILPDQASSPRWEEFDRPLIEAACIEAGIDCVIENAEGDPATMSAIADRMIADGITVLAIVNLDSESGAAIQQRAAAAGVRNIDYDRLTLNGMADVYVSFDNVAVGVAQGEGLLQCLGEGADGARIIQLHGSPDDNNATLVRQGYQSVLAGSGVVTVGEAAVPDWNDDEARVIFADLLAQAGGEIDGVIVANDGLSLAAQGVLAESGARVPTTGQDAIVGALRAILQGDQCMTVYKPVEVEADAVVRAAAALMRGVDPPANTTIDNGTTEIPFVQGQVTSIFFDEVRIPIEDGFVELDAVCAGIEELCRSAGIG